MSYSKNAKVFPINIQFIQHKTIVIRCPKILYILLFRVSQSLRKWGKYTAFLIFVCQFMRFQKVFIENNTRYTFCNSIFCNLGEVAKKQKLDHPENEKSLDINRF